MCGLAGLILGRKRRKRNERELLLESFTRALAASEQRGRHSTGVAAVHGHGRYMMLKCGVPAHRLIENAEYDKVLDSVSARTTILMGHTRYATKGSTGENENNHPIIAGNLLGTHNGQIENDDELFRETGLARRGDVDSEIIFRMAEPAFGRDGVNYTRLKGVLARLRGTLAAVMVSLKNPEIVVLCRGNNPLVLLRSRRHRAILYASEKRFLDWAVDGGDWEPLALDPMQIMFIRHRNIDAVVRRHFKMAPRRRWGDTVMPGVDLPAWMDAWE